MKTQHLLITTIGILTVALGLTLHSLYSLNKSVDSVQPFHLDPVPYTFKHHFTNTVEVGSVAATAKPVAATVVSR